MQYSGGSCSILNNLTMCFLIDDGERLEKDTIKLKVTELTEELQAEKQKKSITG